MTARNLMADLVGPFYDPVEVATLLGLPLDGLAGVQEAGLLLGVQTSDGAWVYPTFQFAGGQVDPVLIPLLYVFRHSPPWSTALWLSGPHDDLDGLTPVEWIRAGNAPEVVTRIAKHVAHGWAA